MKVPDLESVLKSSEIMYPDGRCSQIWPLICGLAETRPPCQLVKCDKVSGCAQGHCGGGGSQLSLQIRWPSRQLSEVVPAVRYSSVTIRASTRTLLDQSSMKCTKKRTTNHTLWIFRQFHQKESVRLRSGIFFWNYFKIKVFYLTKVKNIT